MTKIVFGLLTPDASMIFLEKAMFSSVFREADSATASDSATPCETA
nr:hypothetical protein [Secundilactobacillus odoratitofui]